MVVDLLRNDLGRIAVPGALLSRLFGNLSNTRPYGS